MYVETHIIHAYNTITTLSFLLSVMNIWKERGAAGTTLMIVSRGFFACNFTSRDTTTQKATNFIENIILTFNFDGTTILAGEVKPINYARLQFAHFPQVISDAFCCLHTAYAS